MNQIIEVGIDGMVCDACAQSVERVVGQLDGVENITVDLTSNSATITYNESSVGISNLHNAIEDAGFDVRLG